MSTLPFQAEEVARMTALMENQFQTLAVPGSKKTRNINGGFFQSDIKTLPARDMGLEGPTSPARLEPSMYSSIKPNFPELRTDKARKNRKNQAKRNRHGVGESTELPSLRRLVNQTIDPGLRIEVNAESKLIGKMEQQYVSARSIGVADVDDQRYTQLTQKEQEHKLIRRKHRQNKTLNSSIDNFSSLRYQRSKANLLLNQQNVVNDIKAQKKKMKDYNLSLLTNWQHSHEQNKINQLYWHLLNRERANDPKRGNWKPSVVQSTKASKMPMISQSIDSYSSRRLRELHLYPDPSMSTLNNKAAQYTLETPASRTSRRTAETQIMVEMRISRTKKFLQSDASLQQILVANSYGGNYANRLLQPPLCDNPKQLTEETDSLNIDLKSREEEDSTADQAKFQELSRAQSQLEFQKDEACQQTTFETHALITPMDMLSVDKGKDGSVKKVKQLITKQDSRQVLAVKPTLLNLPIGEPWQDRRPKIQLQQDSLEYRHSLHNSEMTLGDADITTRTPGKATEQPKIPPNSFQNKHIKIQKLKDHQPMRQLHVRMQQQHLTAAPKLPSKGATQTKTPLQNQWNSLSGSPGSRARVSPYDAECTISSGMQHQTQFDHEYASRRYNRDLAGSPDPGKQGQKTGSPTNEGPNPVKMVQEQSSGAERMPDIQKNQNFITRIGQAQNKGKYQQDLDHVVQPGQPNGDGNYVGQVIGKHIVSYRKKAKKEVFTEADFSPIDTEGVHFEKQWGEPGSQQLSCTPDDSRERVSHTQSSYSDDGDHQLQEPKQHTPHQRKKLEIMPEKVQLNKQTKSPQQQAQARLPQPSKASSGTQMKDSPTDELIFNLLPKVKHQGLKGQKTMQAKVDMQRILQAARLVEPTPKPTALQAEKEDVCPLPFQNGENHKQKGMRGFKTRYGMMASQQKTTEDWVKQSLKILDKQIKNEKRQAPFGSPDGEGSMQNSNGPLQFQPKAFGKFADRYSPGDAGHQSAMSQSNPLYNFKAIYNMTPDKDFSVIDGQYTDAEKNLINYEMLLAEEKEIEAAEAIAKGGAPTDSKAERALVATELSLNIHSIIQTLPDLNQKHLDQTLTESILASTMKASRPVSNRSDLEGPGGKNSKMSKLNQKTSPLSKMDCHRQSVEFERASSRAGDMGTVNPSTAQGEDEQANPHLLLVRSLYIHDQNRRTAKVGQFPVKQVWDITPEQKMAHTRSPFNKLLTGEKKLQNSESKQFYQPINIKMHLDFNPEKDLRRTRHRAKQSPVMKGSATRIAEAMLEAVNQSTAMHSRDALASPLPAAMSTSGSKLSSTSQTNAAAGSQFERSGTKKHIMYSPLQIQGGQVVVASKLSQSPSTQGKLQLQKLESSPKHIVIISNQLDSSRNSPLDDINVIHTLDRDSALTKTSLIDKKQPSSTISPRVQVEQRPLLQKRSTLRLIPRPVQYDQPNRRQQIQIIENEKSLAEPLQNIYKMAQQGEHTATGRSFNNQDLPNIKEEGKHASKKSPPASKRKIILKKAARHGQGYKDYIEQLGGWKQASKSASRDSSSVAQEQQQ